MKQTIRLTESELRNMIQNVINEALDNEQGELDEGFWNNLKTGANTFMNGNGGKTGMEGLKNRWNNAKKNYNLQGELDGMQDLVSKLSQYIDAGQISPQMTVAQLVGGKYNNNKFGKMSSQVANRKSQMRKNGFNGDF